MGGSERGRLEAAIAAQESLRGTVPDEVVDSAVRALRAQLSSQGATSEPVAQRRLATVLFADLAGFTAMSEGVDAEVVAGMMNELWSSVDSAITEHGGRVDKHVGDAVMGVWGATSSREDDPERAVRAALDVREAFRAFKEAHELDVDVRVGVNTGPVLYDRVGTTGEFSVTGDAVNVASRVEHIAPRGSVLISHDTYRHVRGVFVVRPQDPIAVKGKSAPLRTYAVDEVKPRAFRVPSRGVEGVETAMVGRDTELEVLRSSYVQTVEGSACRLVNVIGEAGAGKSRLLDEFTGWLDLRPEHIHFLRGRSTPDARAIPRGLLRELFASRFEIFDDDSVDMVTNKLRAGLEPLSERQADVAGHWLGFDLLGTAAVRDLGKSPEFGEIALEHVASHLTWVASSKPVVILLEDVHWADSDSFDAVERLLRAASASPLLVVSVARPSEPGRRPGWDTTQADSSVVRLEPLDHADSRDLAREILQRVDEVSDQLVELIADRSGRNPFFAEELVKMFIDDGIIEVGDDRLGSWHIRSERLDEVAVPTTLAGVIQARLDGLEERERLTLQHASVVGRTFWDQAVVFLAGEQSTPQISQQVIEAALAVAKRRELLRQNERSVFSQCHEFSFKHALLRDATYETVLLSDRQSLHRAAADWLERRSAQRRGEYVGAIAEHRSQAGQLDEAASLFHELGTRSVIVGSLSAAERSFLRALSLKESAGASHDHDATRSRIELGHTLRWLGHGDRAIDAFSTAESDAHALGDEHLAALARVGALKNATVRGRWDEAAELLERSRPAADRFGGAIRGSVLSAEASMHSNGPTQDLDAALAAGEAALEIWHQLGDTTSELLETNGLAAIHTQVVLRDGGSRFPEAERRFRDGTDLARRVGNAHVEKILTANQAVLAHHIARAGEGDYDRVLQLYRSSLEEGRRVGSFHVVDLVNLAQAEVESGRLEEGERDAREALRTAWTHNDPIDWALCIVVFGQLAIARGQLDEGLDIISAIVAHEGTPSLRVEVDAVLDVHGVPPSARSRLNEPHGHRDIGSIVAMLLAD